MRLWEKNIKAKLLFFLVLTRLQSGKKQILLQERVNTGYKDGQYDMACSGHLEKGETLSGAVVREAQEEIGIFVREEDLDMVALIHPYQEGYINVFFEAQKYEGVPQIREQEKCDNLQWFDIDNLPENTIARNRNVIENMKLGIIYDDDDFTNQKRVKSKLEKSHDEDEMVH